MKYEDYVQRALEKLSEQRKVINRKDYALIQCVNPNHKGGNEATPSLRVNLVKTNFSVGSAKCFACGVFYPNWNKLTQALYRPDLSLSEEKIDDSDEIQTSFFSEKIEKAIKEEDRLDPSLLKDLKGGFIWDNATEWRGIKGKMLKAINSKYYFDSKLETPMLYLPCMVNKVEVGGIRARLEKAESFNYINTEGSWVSHQGLFPFDYVKRHITKNDLNTVILVEGPRDALNFCQNKLPALAILGSNNWSEVKADILLSLNITKVITAFDPDEAGDRAKVSVYKTLKNEIEVQNFNFHKWQKKFADKIDPGNSPPEIINSIRKHVI